MLTSPNFLRPGVVGGFILALVPGLVPTVSIGALFAQGTLYRPGSAPVLAAAPASQFSYLGYNSSTGFYWTTNPAGVTAGDAVLGWVETNGTDLIAVSNQSIAFAAAATTTGATDGGTSGGRTWGGGVSG